VSTPEEIAPALRAAVLRLARRLRVEREQSALSNNKVAILSYLHRQGEGTPSEIGAAERQRPQSLSRPLAELEADGLIARTPDAADGRRRRLRLTGAGRASLAADMRRRDQWLARALEGLDGQELGRLAAAASLLDRLGDTLG
jgi:DNA-binding MarR family transcriptional regulator